MDIFGFLLMLLSMVGAFWGIIGFIKGNLKIFRISTRKQAGLLLLACFILFFVGGIILGSTATALPEENAAAVTEDVQGEPEGDGQAAPDGEQGELPDDDAAPAVATAPTVSGNLEVHFIDVGQADAILVKAPVGAMLIDAGNNADADLVTSYIKKQGIDKLDVVVGTHPHEDHIGGLDAVISAFAIGKVYMPKVTHTTQTYEDVLVAIQNKGLKITAPVVGSTFNIGEAKCTILAPNSSSYDDLNNYSIVIKLEYGQTSFLFTGDAEDISEREMLSKGFDLAADLLKIGHHGSASSTTQEFLDEVSPKYAVIMVGADNDYGHPTALTMNKLKAKGITVYRTDENGTIVAATDGTNITFNTKPGSYNSRSNDSSAGNNKSTNTSTSKSPTSDNGSGNSASSSQTQTPVSTPEGSRTVYWTPNGKSYHYTKDCPTLSRSKSILSGPLSQCPKADPCDKCTY